MTYCFEQSERWLNYVSTILKEWISSENSNRNLLISYQLLQKYCVLSVDMAHWNWRERKRIMEFELCHWTLKKFTSKDWKTIRIHEWTQIWSNNDKIIDFIKTWGLRDCIKGVLNLMRPTSIQDESLLKNWRLTFLVKRIRNSISSFFMQPRFEVHFFLQRKTHTKKSSRISKRKQYLWFFFN